MNLFTRFILFSAVFFAGILLSFDIMAENCKGETKDGLKVGAWKCFYDSGVVSQEGTYVNGKKNGIWKLYHDNGKLAGEGNYKDDKEQGHWKFYDDNGTLILEQDYE